jgi:4-hydroxybenzoate polyprenyltransferase
MFLVRYGNPWPLAMSLPVLAFLVVYPILKRFTRLTHFYLGMALALAPPCAYLAVCGRLDWPPIIVSAAVLTWTAGFDILYACQDYEFDVAAGLHSLPSRLGIPAALWVSRITHFLSAAMILLLFWAVPQFRWCYLASAVAAVILLAIEQSLVKPGDLSKVNVAFFTVNGIISLLLGTCGISDLIK